MALGETMRSLRVSLVMGAVGLAFIFLSPIMMVMSQVVEEFVVASGTARFAEQPQIRGNIVVWQRYGEAFGESDAIQAANIGTIGGSVVELAKFPAHRIGVLLSEQYLFFGSGNGFPDGSPVIARQIDLALQGKANDIVVSDVGYAVASNTSHVFIRVSAFEDIRYAKHYYAKQLCTLDDSPPESLFEVASFKSETFLTRTEAASDKYFVWQDRDGADSDDTWKIFAKPIKELFTPGAERMVFETNLSKQPLGYYGAYLALYDNLIVVQGAVDKRSDSIRGIYLIDLDTGAGPLPIAETDSKSTALQWPAISNEYIVWSQADEFSKRRAFAQRLDRGDLDGVPFQISSGFGGGNWIAIYNSVAVWNGVAPSAVGPVNAIIGVELASAMTSDVGDVDQNGRIDLTDAVAVLNFLFLGGRQPRLRVSDTDRNGVLTLNDAIVVLAYLFQGTQIR